MQGRGQVTTAVGSSNEVTANSGPEGSVSPCSSPPCCGFYFLFGHSSMVCLDIGEKSEFYIDG